MLDQYLHRIGYDGPQEPTLPVLRALHYAHVVTIAYENLDVYCQSPVDQDIKRIQQKLVVAKRGGWCYEMNGLLGWALTELGFNVTRLCGAVMREARGDMAVGNHLLLRIDLTQPWIADVGIGDGVREPFPLVPGPIKRGKHTYQLSVLEDGSWRFHNRSGGLPPSFDFWNHPADEDLLATTCTALQTDSESTFRQNLIAQRMTATGVHLLLGKVYTSPSGVRTMLDSETQLARCLVDNFGIANPPVAGVWPSVNARHHQLFGDTGVDELQFGPPTNNNTTTDNP